MKLLGRSIYLAFPVASDAAAVLDLNLRNRAFFQQYLCDRSEEFYTIAYQLAKVSIDLQMAERDQKYSFEIFLSATDELIGNVALTEVVRGPLQTCWLGYHLDRSHNGCGYVTEAVAIVVEHAFGALRLHRIDAGVMPRNVGSIRVLEKAGFLNEGLSRKNAKINGRWEDHLHYAIVNPND